MSKRYGRQQKRKARARIAELEKLAAATSMSISIAKSIVKVARDISPNSICFEPSERDYYPEIPIYEQVLPFPVTSEYVEMRPVDVKTIDLYRLETELRENEFDRMIHFRVGLTHPYREDMIAGYAISKEGLAHTPLDHISREIGYHLKHNA